MLRCPEPPKTEHEARMRRLVILFRKIELNSFRQGIAHARVGSTASLPYAETAQQLGKELVAMFEEASKP